MKYQSNKRKFRIHTHTFTCGAGCGYDKEFHLYEEVDGKEVLVRTLHCEYSTLESLIKILGTEVTYTHSDC